MSLALQALPLVRNCYCSAWLADNVCTFEPEVAQVVPEFEVNFEFIPLLLPEVEPPGYNSSRLFVPLFVHVCTVTTLVALRT